MGPEPGSMANGILKALQPNRNRNIITNNAEKIARTEMFSAYLLGKDSVGIGSYFFERNFYPGKLGGG